MRHIRNFTKMFMMAGFCFIIGACSDDDFIEQEQVQPTDESTIRTIPMEFIGDVVGFDLPSNQARIQTRGTTSSSWNDGDKIYITFYNGNTIVPGEATYNSTSGWSVNYYGNLATGTNMRCEARYFVNATFSNSSLISLNSNSEIYEDVNGKYAYNNGSLSLQATLSPKTGRIRFAGPSGAKIHITGITVYTTFSPVGNTFTFSNEMITSTVASTGSTPYIYGVFSDADRNIGLVGSDFAYTRTCTSDMLKTGESGYMAIPSESAHNNWRYGLYVKASGVEFKMIPVAGYSGGFFLIGETEVTEALYNSVNGTSSTSQLPISAITCSDVLIFVKKLNDITKLSFSIPSKDQWQYAAKGGDLSQGFTYSGSNTPGEVAWYSENSSSRQNVKTKVPNELGIYDMSGNVSEFTEVGLNAGYNDYYHYTCCGGDYNSLSSSIQANSYATYNTYSANSKSYQRGFRILLTFP